MNVQDARSSDAEKSAEEQVYEQRYRAVCSRMQCVEQKQQRLGQLLEKLTQRVVTAEEILGEKLEATVELGETLRAGQDLYAQQIELEFKRLDNRIESVHEVGQR